MDDQIIAKKKRGEHLTYKDFYYYSKAGLGLIGHTDEFGDILVPLREYIECHLCKQLMNNEKNAEKIIQDHLHKYKVLNFMHALDAAEDNNFTMCQKIIDDSKPLTEQTSEVLEEVKTFLENSICDPEYIEACKKAKDSRMPWIEDDYQLEWWENVGDMFNDATDGHYLGCFYPQSTYDELERKYLEVTARREVCK